MKCPHLEISEFGESICHSGSDECPKEYVNTCTVEPVEDCSGDCKQCNHNWKCENINRLDLEDFS